MAGAPFGDISPSGEAFKGEGCDGCKIPGVGVEGLGGPPSAELMLKNHKTRHQRYGHL